MVLEGFSRTGRSAPFTSKFKGSPLLTWARKSDAAFAIPALIEVCFSCFPTRRRVADSTEDLVTITPIRGGVETS